MKLLMTFAASASVLFSQAAATQASTELTASHVNLRDDVYALFGERFIRELTLERVEFDFKCELQVTPFPSGSIGYRLKKCVAEASPQLNIQLDPAKLESNAERQFTLRNMKKVPAGPVHFKLICFFNDSSEFRCGLRQKPTS